MKTYVNEETDAINLCESGLIGIRFLEDGLHIAFDIDWSEGEEPLHIVCSWCSSADFNFKRDRQNCYCPEISAFSYLKDEDGYQVQLDVDYPPGYFRLHCCSFCFQVFSEPLQPGGNAHRIPGDPIKVVLY